ncbi:aldo/keto reductase [Propionibacteriaceae bacterium G57]|uniref:aldo/keto reductase n=1 Tax=Aestuariimicrobium sp. G57 TaxID=3418485 RepID=UPI003DA754DE
MDTTITLRSGNTIPRVGFGTYKIPQAETQAAVEQAIEIGYRHIDTAAMYGNEQGVGAAIKASGIRDELYIATKLDNPYHAPDDARAAFERSMDDLGIDIVDLYLIHWPLPRSTDYAATWQTLVDLQATGRIRDIGVSNFLPEHLRHIIDVTGVVPVINQVELHPFHTQQGLRDVHEQLGIVTEAWSPLARARVFDDSGLAAIAEKVGRTPSQVVLRWHLQLGNVIIPKSTNPGRMAENLDLFDFELDDEAMAAVSALNRDMNTGSTPDQVEVGTLEAKRAAANKS